MQELARVTLENEMDLILAHRRSMKLAELAGLSLSAQTTFATAVSEVSRTTIEKGKSGCLILNVESEQKEKYIVALLKDETDSETKQEGLDYAKRLVNKYKISQDGKETSIELYYSIPQHIRLDITQLDQWRNLFRNEPSVSPYEELKRTHEQLQQLSEKVKESEMQYKRVTNSLPLIIFSINNNGDLLYANEWLFSLTGQSLEKLNESRWKTIVHEEDYNAFLLLLNQNITAGAAAIKLQCRMKSKPQASYIWHQISLSPLKDEEGLTQYWTGYIIDIHAQKVFEETMQDNRELRQTQQQLHQNQAILEATITELNRSNAELQQFAFVASHDLQEPVRKILFYSDYLISQYKTLLDEKGYYYLSNMQSASQRMRNLIQDLLIFSQINKEKISFSPVNLNEVLKDALQDLEMAIEEKGAVIEIENLPTIHADERMMRQLLENIISNSLKYSKKNVLPVLKINCTEEENKFIITIADNGIGFDPKYMEQIFTLFQRLHTKDVYEGTGLGLAICRKIIDLHKGEISATSKEGEGAAFHISLPKKL